MTHDSLDKDSTLSLHLAEKWSLSLTLPSRQAWVFQTVTTVWVEGLLQRGLGPVKGGVSAIWTKQKESRNEEWGVGVITDLLNQRRRATATESNTRIFQLPPWPAALAWLNTCQGHNWNHGLRRTKNYIWLMLMKPAKKDSICFKQSKGHNTKHSGVSCFSSRRCTNRQVSWIIHKYLIFAFTDKKAVVHFSFHPHFAFTFFSISIHFISPSFQPKKSALWAHQTEWVRLRLPSIL